jgi:hypothetical protein
MTHAQKPNFFFRRNERVHLNRRGRQFSRLLAAQVCASAVVMLDIPLPRYCESNGYTLHSPVSPSLLLPCVTLCHQVSNALYITAFTRVTTFPRPDPDYVHALPLFYLRSILIISFFVRVRFTSASLLQALSPNPCMYLYSPHMSHCIHMLSKNWNWCQYIPQKGQYTTSSRQYLARIS